MDELVMVLEGYTDVSMDIVMSSRKAAAYKPVL